MAFNVILKLDDQVIAKAEDVQFSDGRIRIDKGVTVAQVRDAADGGGTARLTVVVRRHKDD